MEELDRILMENVERILEFLFPQCHEEMTLTGSHVYGYPTEDSDVDFMLLDTHKSYVMDRLNTLNILVEKSEVYDCITIRLGSDIINLLFLDDNNLEAWKYANKAMLALKCCNVYTITYTLMHHKKNRCEMFSAMVTEFGGVPMLYEIDSDEDDGDWE